MKAIISLSLIVHTGLCAALPVTDPWNLVQNALAVEKQVSQLEMMASRIEYQVKSAKRFSDKLQNFKYNNIRDLLRQLRSFRNRARAIGYSYQGIVNDFERLYGKDGRFAKNFAAWQKQSDESVKDSMQAQGLLEKSDDHMHDLDKVMQAKMKSEGEAETLHAIGEINAIQTKQLNDLTHIIATDARARQSVVMEARAKEREQQAYEERLMHDFNDHQKSRPLSHFPSLGTTAAQVTR